MEDSSQDLSHANSSISNISQNAHKGNELSRPEILASLKKIAPISLYSASKRLDISYNTLNQAIKEFEFAGLLKTVLRLEGSRSTRVIFFEDKKEEKHGSS